MSRQQRPLYEEWLRRHPGIGATLPRATLRASLQTSESFHNPMRPGRPRRTAYAAISNRYIRLFFSYILKALAHGLTAIGASLRPDEFSTDLQLRPSPLVYRKRTYDTGQNTPKSQYFQYLTELQRKATQSNIAMEKQVKTEQPLNRSVRFRGCLTDATNHIQALTVSSDSSLTASPASEALAAEPFSPLSESGWI